MNSPQTIILIIPNLGRGGAQKVFRDQIAFFSSEFRVIPCVFNWDGAFESDKTSGIHSLDVEAGKGVLGKVFRFLERVRKVSSLKKKYQASVCISHLEGADYVNLLSSRKEKIVCWIHGTKKFDENIEGGIGWIRKTLLIPFLYKRSDLIVTVSNGIRSELVANFRLPSSKIRFIPNGFSIEEIQRKASERDYDLTSEFSGDVLITHCRLSRQKNLPAMIEIYQLVRMKNESAKLVILGDGELRQQLIDHCKSFGLRPYSVWEGNAINGTYDVYFLGYQNNPFQFLTKATLYLLTSAWEGFPLSLCEAMACKIPVLAADCFTGPREIIAPSVTSKGHIEKPLIGEYGILMPLADSTESIELWATTVNQVLQDRITKEKLSSSGVERVKDFDNVKINRQWLRVVTE
jgi:glycosyltransferase involved in cell wall biosynthesis